MFTFRQILPVNALMASLNRIPDLGVSKLIRVSNSLTLETAFRWYDDAQEEEDGYFGQATPRSSRERALVAILDERYTPKVRHAVPLRKEANKPLPSSMAALTEMTPPALNRTGIIPSYIYTQLAQNQKLEISALLILHAWIRLSLFATESPSPQRDLGLPFSRAIASTSASGWSSIETQEHAAAESMLQHSRSARSSS